jgi:hypothetical protein
MAYVDLNPIRAHIVKTPEDSAHTSVKNRIESANKNTQPNNLQPFIGNPSKDMPKGLPFELLDYLQLIELTGRCIREDKAGYIEENTPNILIRLNIPPDNWLTMTKKFKDVFHGAIGHEAVLSDYYQHQQLKRRCNLHCCNKLLG